jgi:hypothetical protein
MTQPAYPAARTAALRIHPHYARHLAQTRVEEERKIALLPDVETIEAIIDVAFWASLRREESYTPRVSLAFVAPPQVDLSLVFERRRSTPVYSRPGCQTGTERLGLANVTIGIGLRRVPAINV